MAQEKLLINHVTIPMYATLRGVNAKNVYDKIGRGEIIVDLVGRHELQLIDLEKNKDVVFKPWGDRKRKTVKLKKAKIKA